MIMIKCPACFEEVVKAGFPCWVCDGDNMIPIHRMIIINYEILRHYGMFTSDYSRPKSDNPPF